MLSDDPDGWDRDWEGGPDGRGHVFKRADSLPWRAESNTL